MALHHPVNRQRKRDEQVPPRRAVDEVLSPVRLLVLGLQHLFIMYAGAIAVPLIAGAALKLPTSTIGLLVSADLLVSGIATVIQGASISKILGVRLPVVAGATFTTCWSWRCHYRLACCPRWHRTSTTTSRRTFR
jgi:xanthine/uracil permease